ncbi:MAG: YtxH domain-containing protein [Vicinamibacterales bacterium]
MMTHESNGNVPSMMVGLAIGAFAGASLALLLAPASGTETRARLRRRGRELANDTVARAQEALSAERARVADAVEHGLDRAAAIGQRVASAVDEGKAAYREVKGRAHTVASELRGANGPTA